MLHIPGMPLMERDQQVERFDMSTRPRDPARVSPQHLRLSDQRQFMAGQANDTEGLASGEHPSSDTAALPPDLRELVRRAVRRGRSRSCT
jgi:hypothetical protein